MRKALIIVGVLSFLLVGCQGMFGTIPGDHWRVAISDSDKKLEADSAANIGRLLAQRLHLVVLAIVPESDGGFVDMSDSPQPGNIRIVVHVVRSESQLIVESQYFGRSADAAKLQAAMAQQVLSILKELYPHSVATPFTAYRGLLGP